MRILLKFNQSDEPLIMKFKKLFIHNGLIFLLS